MSSSLSIYSRIYSGVSDLHFSITKLQIEKLVKYIELLIKWNKVYNLTAIRDPDHIVYRHILDSLSVAPYIKNGRMLDVGSGPGLPGIPLAILYPEKQITVLDSNGKKTRFMDQVKAELCLKNVTVVNARVESYQPNCFFDEIISRAFSSLSHMIKGTKHLLSQSGVYLAMKGLYPEKELRELTEQTKSKLVESIKLTVPESEGERHLMILRNK